MKKLFTTLVLLVSSASYGANHWHTSSIEKVYPLSSGDFALIFTSNHSGCTNPNDPQYFYVFDGENSMTVEGRDKIYSAALAAAAMGKTVTIKFSDNTSSCFINALRVNY